MGVQYCVLALINALLFIGCCGRQISATDNKVKVKYYEADNWSKLPELAVMSSYKSELVPTIDFTSRAGSFFASSGRDRNVAALFTGYLKKTYTSYKFCVSTAGDIAKLWVDDVKVLDINHTQKVSFVNDVIINDVFEDCIEVPTNYDPIKISLEYLKIRPSDTSLLSFKYVKYKYSGALTVPRASDWTNEPTKPSIFHINAKYYEVDDSDTWSEMPELAIQEAYKEENVHSIGFHPTFGMFAGSNLNASVAAQFTGYLPQTHSTNTFCVSTNDRAKLYVDNLKVLDMVVDEEDVEEDGAYEMCIDVDTPYDPVFIKIEYLRLPEPMGKSALVFKYAKYAYSGVLTIPEGEEWLEEPTQPTTKNVLAKYYEVDDSLQWSGSIPELGILPHYKTELVSSISFPPTYGNFGSSGRNASVALLLEGYLQGRHQSYTFCVLTNDRAKLYVDDVKVLDIDVKEEDVVHDGAFENCVAEVATPYDLIKIRLEYQRDARPRGRSALIFKYTKDFYSSTLTTIPDATDWQEEPEKSSIQRVHARYYEVDDSSFWLKMPELAIQEHYKAENVSTINYAPTWGDFGSSGRNRSVAALFEGFVSREFPSYSFCILTNDRAKLYVDGEKYLDIDVEHEKEDGAVEFCADDVPTPFDPIAIKVEYIRGHNPIGRGALVFKSTKYTFLSSAATTLGPKEWTEKPPDSPIKRILAKYYEVDSSMSLEQIPELAIMPHYKAENVSSINYFPTWSTFAGSDRNKQVAALFVGYLPKIYNRYTFCIMTNDRAKLYVDDKKILDISVKKEDIVDEDTAYETCVDDVTVSKERIKISIEYMRGARPVGKSALVLKFIKYKYTGYTVTAPEPEDWDEPPVAASIFRVKAKYYEVDDSPFWSKLPELGIQEHYKSEHISTIDFAPTYGNFASSERQTGVAAQFVGYIARLYSTYTFCVSTNDKVKLYVDDTIHLHLSVDEDDIEEDGAFEKCVNVQTPYHPVKVQIDFLRGSNPPGRASLTFKYMANDFYGDSFNGIPKVIDPSDWVEEPPKPLVFNVMAKYFALNDSPLFPDLSYEVPFKEERVSTIFFPPTYGAFAGSGQVQGVAALFEGFLKGASTMSYYDFCVLSNDQVRFYVDHIKYIEMDENNVIEDVPNEECVYDIPVTSFFQIIKVEYKRHMNAKGPSSLVLKYAKNSEDSQYTDWTVVQPEDWIESPLPNLSLKVKVRYFDSALWSTFPDLTKEVSYKSENVAAIHFQPSTGPFAGSGRERVAASFEGFLVRKSSQYNFCIASDGKVRLYVDNFLRLDMYRRYAGDTKLLLEECVEGVKTLDDLIKIRVEYLRSDPVSDESALILTFRPQFGRHYYSIPDGYDWSDPPTSEAPSLSPTFSPSVRGPLHVRPQTMIPTYPFRLSTSDPTQQQLSNQPSQSPSTNYPVTTIHPSKTSSKAHGRLSFLSWAFYFTTGLLLWL